MAEEIGLYELILQVKKELLAPSPDDPVPLFYVEGVELELGVAARKEGQAGIKLYVVDFSGGGRHERAQTVRVHLRPLYSREEMRRLVERDPVLGPQLSQVAVSGTTKDVFGDREHD
jgi:hypothetical protein